MKWDTFVLDIQGTALEENLELLKAGESGWELVAVVPMHMCRRAYFKRPQKENEKPGLKYAPPWKAKAETPEPKKADFVEPQLDQFDEPPAEPKTIPPGAHFDKSGHY